MTVAGAHPSPPPQGYVDGLGQVFFEATSSGRMDTATLPSPIALTDGLRIQLDVLALHAANGQRVGGWKVGLTSGPARDKMGEGFRPFGYILESRIFTSGCELDLAGIPATVAIEPELCFRFDKPLYGADITAEDVAAAIDLVAPAFEIHQPRVPAGSDPGAILADDLGQWGIVVGPETPWAVTASEVVVELRRDDTVVARVGPGFSIDEPAQSIAKLCSSLAQFGLGVEPGQRVITGAFHHSFVDGPGSWTAFFEPGGQVEVTFV